MEQYYSERITLRNGYKRTIYYVPCQGCSGFRKVQKSDITRAQICPRCQRSVAGKAGFAALVEKLGLGGALDLLATRMQKHQREHPSKPMQQVISIFEQHKLNFTCEYTLKGDGHIYSVDALVIVNGRAVAVEVDGGYYHALAPQQQCDAHKRALLSQAGIPLVVVKAHEVNHAASKVMEAAYAIR